MNRTLLNQAVFRILIPPFLGLVAYLLILLFYNDITLFVTFFTGQELYVVIILTYVVLEGCRWINILVDKFYSFTENSYNSIALQFILVGIYSYFIVSVLLSLYFTQVMGFSVSRMQLAVFVGIFLTITLLYQFFYSGLYFMNMKNVSRLNEEKARNQGIVDAAIRFTSEINPRMLYDSLESLIVLSKKNPDEADEFINDLSGIYRYILSHRQSELVNVRLDFEMTQKMVGVLNKKYRDAIIFEGVGDIKDLHYQLIPGTLPKLVERIVENSIVTPSFPLHISCEYEQDSDYIVLAYKVSEKLILSESSILKEIQHSYSFFSDKPLVHVQAYGQGYVKIPTLLHQEAQTA